MSARFSRASSVTIRCESVVALNAKSATRAEASSSISMYNQRSASACRAISLSICAEVFRRKTTASKLASNNDNSCGSRSREMFESKKICVCATVLRNSSSTAAKSASFALSKRLLSSPRSAVVADSRAVLITRGTSSRMTSLTTSRAVLSKKSASATTPQVNRMAVTIIKNSRVHILVRKMFCNDSISSQGFQAQEAARVHAAGKTHLHFASLLPHAFGLRSYLSNGWCEARRQRHTWRSKVAPR